MIHLRATVQCKKDAASLPNKPTGSENTAHVPVPDWIEIEQGHEGGYLLVHVYLREGPFIHTWHATLEEAKAEAKEDFGIDENEWVAVPSEAQTELRQKT